MALWGATAGVATLVGPILGGILVDALGWEWIFFINVPVGVIGFFLAVRLVPTLPTHTHSFDWLGVALSGAGMFFLVFGIQQGHKYHWNGWVVSSIAAGIVLFAVFVFWQSRNRTEPLVPLSLFSDRNFSISSFAISTMSFTATAMGFPTMLYAQLVRGYSPLESALLFVPMAVMSIILAPIVGRFTDKVHPRLLTGVGFAITALSIYLISLTLTPSGAVWHILAAMGLLGIGMAGIWAPLAATATRNLPMRMAGAGSGVYNATRQVGAVLGSAAIAVLIDSRIAAHGLSGGAEPEGALQQLPSAVRDPFSQAMSDAMLLPAAVLVLGLVSVLFFQLPRHLSARAEARTESAQAPAPVLD
jgi:EmrB/QacA subfamily drug resistance transporter